MAKKLAVFVGLMMMVAGCGQPGGSSRPTPPPTRDNSGGDSEPTAETTGNQDTTTAGGFTLTSSVMENGGDLPVTFTCEGESISPPLAWDNPPDGTVSYALAMHHVPGPGDTHWYWVVYDIPADTLSLEAGATGVGTYGINSVNGQQEYAPPCSQGPGEKLYTLTVYALSGVPDLPAPDTVDRDTLLAAIADITLASASMDVTFERTPEG